MRAIVFTALNEDLQTLRNIENQQLEALRVKHKDTYDATRWLRENRNMFKGTVYEPVMLCVSR